MAINTCPTCGSALKPLATSSFCPNDCDRKVASTSSWNRYKDSFWYYMELKIGDRIPEDATRGWYINEVGALERAMHYIPWKFTDPQSHLSVNDPVQRPMYVFKYV